MTLGATIYRILATAMLVSSFSAFAATGNAGPEWLPWILLGAIALLVAGIALRMFLAARFPKGYGAWARSRRDTFAENNAQWDRDDEARK